ncbi:hypothetical protein [Phocaeicola sp.]
MHYSQGRDRWFGRIQSAPTVNVNKMCRKSSSRGDEVTSDYGE